MLVDVIKSESGAYISLATSSDKEWPAENIIDGKPNTFWITTGLFPQEFVLTFKSVMQINVIQVVSYGVKKLSIEKGLQVEPLHFEPLVKKSFDHVEGQLQSHIIDVNSASAIHLRFVIHSGFEQFVTVHKLSIDGASRGSVPVPSSNSSMRHQASPPYPPPSGGMHVMSASDPVGETSVTPTPGFASGKDERKISIGSSPLQSAGMQGAVGRLSVMGQAAPPPQPAIKEEPTDTVEDWSYTSNRPMLGGPAAAANNNMPSMANNNLALVPPHQQANNVSGLSSEEDGVDTLEPTATALASNVVHEYGGDDDDEF